MADMNEVATLLQVLEKAHAQGSQFDNIKNAVLAKLKQINDEHAPKETKPPAPPPVKEVADTPKRGEK